MIVQTNNKPLLDPYRTLGIFVSGALALSKSAPHVFTVPTGTSFRVYSNTLAMKVVSPPLGSKVTAACSYNEYTYVRVQDEILKLKYHHVVRRWEAPGSGQSCTLLCFQKLLILGEGNSLTLFDEQSGQISTVPLNFNLKGLIHPVTYINKMLAYSSSGLTLLNVMSGKMLYQYSKFQQLLGQAECEISCVQPANIVDIVGVALSNGSLAFLNLKKDQVVFSMRQKLPAKCMAFSAEQPWLATGDELGNLILWDLQNKRIFYKFEQCFQGEVDSIVFVPGMPVLTCASSSTNAIKQLRVNTDDNKILTLLRERIGTIQPLQLLKINNNNQLVLSTSNASMFMSFYSQCNNYILPKVLDSRLPMHLIVRHFNVQLWKERTLDKTFKLHQHALIGKISLSCRYYIVATARRMVRLGASYELEWKIPAVREILVFNQHSIYAFTEHQIIVCDFNTSNIMGRFEKRGVEVPTLNVFGNLMAFYSRKQKQIQIWDMAKMSQGRVFPLQNCQGTLCLSFTADNRYLISTHNSGSLLIWNIVDCQLYKHYNLSSDMIFHSFTPDNQFMLSIFKGQREVNVWNNYIGKISSNRVQEKLEFVPEVREVHQNYRKELAKGQTKIEVIQQSDADVLDEIPDAEDDIPEYSFQEIAKWMPLVYYDEIKARNTPEAQLDNLSLPFFLDFKNITEEKKKIQQEIRKQKMEKKKQYLQQKDKHLKTSKNQINLTFDSTTQDHLATFQSLSKLSVGEVDYQLRSFLLTPSHAPLLLNMLVSILKDTSPHYQQEVKNIIVSRVMTIIGSDLLSQQCVPVCQQLYDVLCQELKAMKEKVDRCISVADHSLK